ncbi:MAG TPA: sigma 54-interacting transcriptional regulator [Aliidongia sp.]|uniref:sigma-54 interaction domain-containing protein n=1 Tax=Aliidongia sp. TaxID=1914230 RepID=UPI002DDCDEAC|nr:sigma 54-interacting transcriptional regulator [Aliidongia sp.]HEV2673048.1 sigma 54-interacting transcriptional regulator [Aliidongia sp.]
MTDRPGTSIDGIIARNGEGRITLSQGIGTDPRLQALVSDKAWLREARARRVQSVIIDRQKLIALITQTPEGELILFSRLSSGTVLEFLSSVDFAYDILDHILNDPFEAVTVVDADGKVVYFSPVHEKFFGLGHGEANGRPVREVIENTRLDMVVKSGKAEIGVIQEMRGSQRVVSRVPIRHDGKIVGAMGRVMFKGPEQVEKLSRRVNALESKVAFYKREAASLRRKTYGLDDLIGDSPEMRRLRREIIKVAPLELPVLIRGESGTGKELVAHSLHRLSPRREEKMVMVNAAALPSTLVESELFGYEAGAFTGADRKGRRGKFEQASDGSIFLDEIGDMPIEVQVKLLRVLQDHVIEPIGSERAIEVNFRLITATNRNLQQLVSEEKFRLDLFYRISTITIDVPPLRKRLDDIPLLVDHFLREYASLHGQRSAITDEAMSYLMEQSWPGNVRQLYHEIERALVFAENGRITMSLLTDHSVPPSASDAMAFPGTRGAEPEPTTLKAAIENLELKLIREALERRRGNKKRVAEELGISRSYIYKILGEQGPREG